MTHIEVSRNGFACYALSILSVILKSKWCLSIIFDENQFPLSGNDLAALEGSLKNLKETENMEKQKQNKNQNMTQQQQQQQQQQPLNNNDNIDKNMKDAMEKEFLNNENPPMSPYFKRRFMEVLDKFIGILKPIVVLKEQGIESLVHLLHNQTQFKHLVFSYFVNHSLFFFLCVYLFVGIWCCAMQKYENAFFF